MKKVDELTTEVKSCIDELIVERSSSIVIMRIEVVNRFLNLNEIYKENNKLHKYLWLKYTTKDKQYYSEDELSTEDMNKRMMMNNKLNNVHKLRRRTETRIDKIFKELNFRKEKVSMFVMYIK